MFQSSTRTARPFEYRLHVLSQRLFGFLCAIGKGGLQTVDQLRWLLTGRSLAAAAKKGLFFAGPMQITGATHWHPWQTEPNGGSFALHCSCWKNRDAASSRRAKVCLDAYMAHELLAMEGGEERQSCGRVVCESVKGL
jgi:hypothetical protein